MFGATIAHTYDLEYGTTIEHWTQSRPVSVVIMDDLLATGVQQQQPSNCAVAVSLPE